MCVCVCVCVCVFVFFLCVIIIFVFSLKISRELLHLGFEIWYKCGYDLLYYI